VQADGAAVSVSVEVPVRPAAPRTDDTLPRTGWDAGALTALGFALVLLGALIVLAVRSRLERPHHA
jgi:LPXTG-motif cell wall-anchored protein